MTDLNKVHNDLRKGLVFLGVFGAALSLVSATLSLYLTVKKGD